MLVEVTEEDIRSGRRNGCYDCPIALAIRRACGRGASVGTFTVTVEGMGRFALPAKASKRIEAYDDGHAMRPFTFELGLPWGPD